MLAATLTSTAIDTATGQASPISIAQSDDLEQASLQARTVSTDLRPQKQEYFKDRATIVISAYQGVAGFAAIAGTVAVIAGVLLKDPYIITMGLGCMLLGGGGFVLAGKYRQLKSQNQIFDDMLAENGRLKGQVHFFEDQNKSLEQSNSHLKGQVGELSNKVVALQQTVTRFDQENDELRQSNEQLSDQIGELTEKVKELLQNVRRFDEENEELKSSNSLLKGHVTNLESMSGRFEVSVGEMVKNEQSFKILRDQYETLQKQFIQAQEKEIAHDIERQRIDGVRQEKEEQMLEREEEGIRQLQLIAQKEELLLSREEEIMKGLSFLHQKESALKAQEEKIVKSLTDFALERGDLMRLRAIISKLRELNPQLVSNVEEQLVSFVDVPVDFLA
jgi:DNA repair exonuclease SbcCD ATPase subunit